MADKAVAFKGGAAPIPSAGTTGTNNAQPRSSSPAEAKSIADVFALCQSPSQLSKEGEAYVEKIVDTLKNSGREATATKIVGGNYEGRVIECNGLLACFVFTETYIPNVEAVPVATCVDDFRNCLTTAKFDPSRILQFIVVTKEDYEKVDVMAAFITNMFMAVDTTAVKNLSAAQFTGNNFRITEDLTAIRAFVEKNYPMKTLPRMDAGILLYATRPIENAFDRNGRPEMQQVPIVAVTGYTDFTYATSGIMYAQQTKFAPTFVITGIFSKLVNTAMGAIGLSLGSYMFIRNGRWLNPFSSFQKGARDLGNLLLDDKGKPVHVTNVNERNKILDGFMNTKIPYLALDLQLGTPMIPGLKDLFTDKANFNNMVDAFTGGSGAAQSQNPVQVVMCRFDGRVRINKSGVADYSDTREVDYLHLVQTGADQSQAAEFLTPTLEPKSKCDALRFFYKEAELLYVTSRAVLNPAWIDAVAMDLGQTLKVTLEGGLAPNTYDVTSLAAFQPMGMGMMPNFTMPTGSTSFNGGFFY